MTSDTLQRRRTAGSYPIGRPPRRSHRRLVVLLLVVALLAGSGWLIGFSSVLTARAVEVSGITVLTADQVRAAAQVPPGIPLARQDVDEIARRVARLELVSSVTVARRWPRTITVVVQERTPSVAIRRPEGFLLVDAAGFGFLTVPQRPDSVSLTDVDPANAPLLSQVGLVAAALPPKLRPKVALIRATSADHITLTLDSGDVAVWGGAADSSLKAQVLSALIKRPARTYDVSAPHNPALR